MCFCEQEEIIQHEALRVGHDRDSFKQTGAKLCPGRQALSRVLLVCWLSGGIGAQHYRHAVPRVVGLTPSDYWSRSERSCWGIVWGYRRQLDVDQPSATRRWLFTCSLIATMQYMGRAPSVRYDCDNKGLGKSPEVLYLRYGF